MTIMFCENCGTQNEDDAKFCLECGALLTGKSENAKDISEEMQTGEPTFPENWQSSPQAVSLTEAQQYQPPAVNPGQPEGYYQPQPFYQAASPAPKKRKKFAIVTVVAVLLAAGGIGGYFFYPKIIRMTMGEQKYYVFAEKNSIKGNISELSALLKTSGSCPQSVKGEITCEVGEGSNYLSSDIATVIEKFSFGIDTNYDPVKKIANNTYSANYDGKALGSVKLKQTEQGSELLFPELSDGHYVIDSANWYIDLLTGDEKELEAMTGLAKKDREKLLEQYLTEVIVKSIPDANIQKGKNLYNGKQYETVTFIIDNTVVKNMMKAFSAQLKREETKKLILATFAYYREKMKSIGNDELLQETEFPGDDQVSALIDETAKELDLRVTSESSEFAEKFSYTVYYGTGGNIVVRELTNKDQQFKATVANYKIGADTIFEILVSDGDSGVQLKNSFSQLNNNISGKLFCTINSGSSSEKNTLFEVKYTYEKNGKTGGVPFFIGSVDATINISMLSETVIDSYMDDASLCVNISSKKKSDNKVSVSAYTDVTFGGSEEISFTLNGDFTISNKPNVDGVTISKNSTISEEDFSQIAENFTQNLMEATGGGYDAYDTDAETDEYYTNGIAAKTSGKLILSPVGYQVRPILTVLSSKKIPYILGGYLDVL